MRRRTSAWSLLFTHAGTSLCTARRDLSRSSLEFVGFSPLKCRGALTSKCVVPRFSFRV